MAGNDIDGVGDGEAADGGGDEQGVDLDEVARASGYNAPKTAPTPGGQGRIGHLPKADKHGILHKSI